MQTHATLNDPAQTRLPLSTADLAQLRFAYSPIWELILSIRLLQSPERHALYTGWLQCTLPKLADLDLRLLTSLIRPSGYFPDFLTPPPASSHPSFAGELAQLAKTPPEQIQQQVQHAIGEQAPDSVQARYLRQPAASLRQLVDLLERYWQRALAEHWPGLQRVLEGDVLARGHSLALGGPTQVFQELHPGLRFDQNDLVLSKRTCKGQITLGERGLVLIPSVFAWPEIYLLCDAIGQPCICYSARGVGLWDSEQSRPDAALTAAVGESRSLLLRALVTPISTGDLAAMLHLSPGAVSQQLTRLTSAGLAESQRHGRRVYYQLSSRGERLLSLFS